MVVLYLGWNLIVSSLRLVDLFDLLVLPALLLLVMICVYYPPVD